MPDKYDLIKKAEEDCKAALGTRPGQLILRMLIMMGGVYTPYTRQDTEKLPVSQDQAMAYLEGRRSMAVQMMNLGGFTQIKVEAPDADL